MESALPAKILGEEIMSHGIRGGGIDRRGSEG